MLGLSGMGEILGNRSQAGPALQSSELRTALSELWNRCLRVGTAVQVDLFEQGILLACCEADAQLCKSQLPEWLGVTTIGLLHDVVSQKAEGLVPPPLSGEKCAHLVEG